MSGVARESYLFARDAQLHLEDFLQNQRFILIEDMKVKRLPVVDERDFYEK